MNETIRPGLLVALKSSLSGGTTYERKTIESEMNRSKWETTRTYADAEEHDRAAAARSRALREIRNVCSATSFGHLCPQDAEPELDAAIARAMAIRDEHNRTARFTRFDVFVLKGRIAQTDEEAARAIASEIQGLIGDMSASIDRLDPDAIREAANKAKRITAMLSPDKAEAVEGAVAAARAAARVITKRVQKDGESAVVVLADVQRGGIERARIAFLDLEDRPSVASAAAPLPQVNAGRFAELGAMVENDGEHDASVKEVV